MSLAKSNRHLRQFEKLESRWLLAADTGCDITVEASVPTIELVAELLDPAGVDFHCDVDVDQPANEDPEMENDVRENQNPDAPSDQDGEETDALDEQSIGGEGESAPAAEARVTEFDNDREQVASDQPATEGVSLPAEDVRILPADFLRLNNNFVRAQSDTSQQLSDPANAQRIEPPRPVIPFTSEVTREPGDLPESSNRTVDPVEITLRSTERSGDFDKHSIQDSILPFAEQSVSSIQRPDPIDITAPLIAVDHVDLSWLSRERIGDSDDQSRPENSDFDEALMGYLRTIQWPLVPLVAGLAYAVTRSVDREAETPEPQLMAMRRRRAKTT